MPSPLPRLVPLPDGREVLVRLIEPTDSIPELTRLLHLAYRPLAEQGMRFFASHQTDEDTQQRIEGAWCLVAFLDGILVGTITLYRPGQSSGTPFYEQPHVVRFGQFAVDPALQGLGLGSILLELVEGLARADGATELALDTAETAQVLIDYYTRRGHRFIEHVQWKVTNYRSVVMSKGL